MSKETYYFSHDYNARSDIKIKKLIAKHGYTGYGIFWAIIEDLYQNANALQTDYELLAYEYRVDCEIIKSIINDFDLFVIDNGFFGSMSVQNRLDKRDEKSQKARESALYRWNKKGDNANAMRTHNDSNAIKERKGKDNKENKKKKTYKELAHEFYNLELEKNKDTELKLEYAKYKQYVELVLGKTDHVKNTDNFLKVQEQLSFENFLTCLKVEKETGVKLAATIKEMINYKPLHIKNDTINLTAQNWMRRKNK